MNVLVLTPGGANLKFSLFGSARRAALCSGAHGGYFTEAPDVAAVLQRVREECNLTGSTPDLLAMPVPYGGETFKRAAVVDATVLDNLHELLPFSPMHLPQVLMLLEAAREVFPETPAVLTFGTSFFVDLPLREQRYGLDREQVPWLRRFAYQGLYHQAACEHVLRKRRAKEQVDAQPRILSICLENQPEAAAIIGRRPVMVTSGATPLEGLPGSTSCGELDGGIVLSLAQQLSWGPEQINRVLTQESGLLGLVGRPTNLKEVFSSTAADVQLARQVMEYRLLLAAGSAAAAMGGLDVIIFSGRWATVGQALGPHLVASLPASRAAHAHEVAWRCLRTPLARIVADLACAQALATRRQSRQRIGSRAMP